MFSGYIFDLSYSEQILDLLNFSALSTFPCLDWTRPVSGLTARKFILIQVQLQKLLSTSQPLPVNTSNIVILKIN